MPCDDFYQSHAAIMRCATPPRWVTPWSTTTNQHSLGVRAPSHSPGPLCHKAYFAAAHSSPDIALLQWVIDPKGQLQSKATEKWGCQARLAFRALPVDTPPVDKPSLSASGQLFHWQWHLNQVSPFVLGTRLWLHKTLTAVQRNSVWLLYDHQIEQPTWTNRSTPWFPNIIQCVPQQQLHQHQSYSSAEEGEGRRTKELQFN